MNRFIFLLLCLFSFPAFADQPLEDLCDNLSAYVPIDGVEYAPGATEVPVDLNSIQDAGTGSISIPVEIDLGEYFNRPELSTNTPGLLLRPTISDIVVNQDGSVFYNGQEISQDIRAACGGKGRDMTKVEKPKAVVSSPKPSIAPTAVKSRVKVTSGENVVISTNKSNDDDKKVPAAKTEVAITPPKKPAYSYDNSVDVEPLKEQDNTDQSDPIIDNKDSILEGQYP